MNKLDAYTILVMLIITNVIAILWALYRILFEGKQDYREVGIAGGFILFALLFLKINEHLQKAGK